MNILINIEESARHADGLAKVIVEVPDLGLRRELDLPFTELYERCDIPDDLTLDLLLSASLCYVIDKTVPRDSASDRWTREMSVTIPVSDAKKWQKAAADLNAALGFLTGDVWQVSFRSREEQLFQKPVRRRRRKTNVSAIEQITAVCLFSGGIDSLTGAIDLLAGSEHNGLRLVGHYDAAGAASAQRELFTALESSYPGRTELLQVRVSHKPSEAVENTLRSRSLLFMALGIYAARAAGQLVPVYAPENGLIAINIPLTPSRSGSCSTRTMHPFFLNGLRAVLGRLGIDNQIINPFELKTKGECVAKSLNFRLFSSLVEKSVSCSHPTRKQYWRRRAKEVRNCGYCVPCLIRRAALHRAGLDDPQSYGVDVCSEELGHDYDLESANDFRAVLDMVSNGKTIADFRRDMLSVAPVDRLDERAQMIERGFEEIRTLIRQKGVESVRRTVGVASAGR